MYPPTAQDLLGKGAALQCGCSEAVIRALTGEALNERAGMSPAPLSCATSKLSRMGGMFDVYAGAFAPRSQKVTLACDIMSCRCCRHCSDSAYQALLHPRAENHADQATLITYLSMHDSEMSILLQISLPRGFS